MKTKYSSVLKIQKQNLDKAESNLSKARARLRQNELEFELASKQCEELSLPSSGSVQNLKQSLEILGVARAFKENKKEKLILSNKEVSHYQMLYKRANLEYEKIKYLESEELKKIKEKIKKEEEKFIDEIAISRYVYGEKKI